MKKLVSIVLMLALVSLILGSAIPVAAAEAVTLPSSVPAEMVMPAATQASSAVSTNVTLDVWHITFETKGSGASANWTQDRPGFDTRGSATLSVSSNNSGALVLVENDPLLFTEVSGNSTSSVKSSVMPVSGNISESLEYFVYADANADGQVDYNLSVPLTQESLITAAWVNFVPVLREGQVKWMINQDFHGFTAGSWHTWEEYRSVSGNDTIIRLGVALSGAKGPSSAAVDSLTLGTRIYDISGLQDTIDRAAEGDTVSVHPGKYDEFIDINKSLTVESTDGSEATIIQPAVIPPVSPEYISDFGQVVLITAQDVTFEGFKVIIDGYLNAQYQVPDTGIIAVLPELQKQNSSSQTLNILNNNIRIKQVMQAAGIVVLKYSGKIYITDNQATVSSNITDENGSATVSGIEVISSDYAILEGNTVNLEVNSGRVLGIYNSLCGTVLAGENLVTVKTGNLQTAIEGIYFDRVSDVLAEGNKVDLKAGGNYSYLEGIGIWDWAMYNEPSGNYTEFVFNKAMVDNNLVSCNLTFLEGEAPEPWDLMYAEVDGIWIQSGSRVEVFENEVVSSANCRDFAYVDGITVVKIGGEVQIDKNKITLDGLVVKTGSTEILLNTSTNRHSHSSNPETQDSDIYDIIGSIVYNTGVEGYGIATYKTGLTGIYKNEIKGSLIATAVTEHLPTILTGNQTVTAGTTALGITTWNAEGPQIISNSISISSLLFSGNLTKEENPLAVASGFALAIGVDVNASSGAVIQENSIKAEAMGLGLVVASSPEAAFAHNLVMDNLQSTLLNNLSDIVSQVAGQTADVDLQGRSLASISVAQAAYGIIGLGILANDSANILVMDNDPVTGVAMGEVETISIDWQELSPSSAMNEGLAIGMGGGILLIGCEGGSIVNNGTGLTGWVEEEPYENVPEKGVAGNARIYAYLAAVESVMTESIGAAQLSASISFGILALDSVISGLAVSPGVTISGNHIVSNGYVLSSIRARDYVTDEVVVTQCANLSLRLGIGTMVDMAVIRDNTVTVADYSIIRNLTQGITEQTAASENAAAGLSLGIFTYGGTANQILKNHVESTAESLTMTGIDNRGHLEAEDASGLSGDLSLSVGILSIGGVRHTIQGNYSRAGSVAVAEVYADSGEPLDEASATGIAVTFASGLVLVGNIIPAAASTDVTSVTENYFEARADAAIGTETSGYFLDNTLVGLGFQLNALVLASECNFNYNDLVSGNETEAQSTEFYVQYYDFGLLNLSSLVNARYNYWGDSSGPGGIASGNGTALGEMSLSGTEVSLNTPYSWWLSHPVSDLLENKVGYYGFGYQLHAGWNTLSVPMALENPLWTTPEKTGIADNGLDWEIAYYYDPSLSQPWVQITKDLQYQLKPLEGIYVKMKSDGMVFLASSPAVTIPTRSLKEEQSWYLIGPTPYDSYFPFTYSMPVDLALKSIEKTAGGLVGYDQVVSPAVGDQQVWVYTAGQVFSNYPVMVAGKAYWVFMENKDTLAGFIATPMPARLPIGGISYGSNP